MFHSITFFHAAPSLHLVGTGRSALPADPREEQRRRSSLLSQKSPKYLCQKSALESSYLNSRGTTQTSLKLGEGAKCRLFQMQKPACCKTPARVKWRLVWKWRTDPPVTRDGCHLFLSETTVKLYLKRVKRSHPGWRVCFLFSQARSKLRHIT